MSQAGEHRDLPFRAMRYLANGHGREQAGIRPLDANNDRAVVRSFGSLLGSVRAYMHNLNTHSHYQKFRKARFGITQTPKGWRS